ncbi:SDR family oxidoreductase [Streptomyces sp. NPDC057011]|uniref:SDR family oxidoreductase n=1 Tax=unclassified Streptomyces TaxID=2593676 RepID=UPI003639AE96
MSRLTNKTALVTGASRGIGRAIAERLGREGALVAVHYAQDREAAENTVKAIAADGGRAFTVRAEFGVPGAVETLFEQLRTGLETLCGTAELDILVNNAGINTTGAGPEETTPELFDRLMAVNAKAPFFVVQRALPVLRDGGRIITISSGLTRYANPKEVAYAMTKGAVEMIGLHFARHLGPRRITVNTVSPGVTDTGHAFLDVPGVREALSGLAALGGIAQPSDIADVVAFLASDDARRITGAVLDASGGSLLG